MLEFSLFCGSESWFFTSLWCSLYTPWLFETIMVKLGPVLNQINCKNVLIVKMFPELLLYSIMVYLLILISSINTWEITSRLEIICIKHTNENLYIHSVKSIYARTWLIIVKDERLCRVNEILVCILWCWVKINTCTCDWKIMIMVIVWFHRHFIF